MATKKTQKFAEMMPLHPSPYSNKKGYVFLHYRDSGKFAVRFNDSGSSAYRCAEVYPVVVVSKMDEEGERDVEYVVRPDFKYGQTISPADTDRYQFIDSLDELPMAWDKWNAEENMDETIFVYCRTTCSGRWGDGWPTILMDRVGYDGLVEGHTDATDGSIFYRTIGELTAYYKKLYTPKTLDTILRGLKDKYNGPELERRKAISDRMGTLMAMRGKKVPTVGGSAGQWWNNLTEEEKEAIYKAKRGKKVSKK